MESVSTDAIINALQQLKIATYDSLNQFDRTYSFDTYKNGLKLLESRGQVSKIVFPTRKAKRYVWFLPWYEDDAKEKLRELENVVLTYLETTPSTSWQIRDYLRENYPAYHQIAYLALRQLVARGRIRQMTFKEERLWLTIYYLPEKSEMLEDLMLKALEYVQHNGFAFGSDLSDSLNIPKRLAFALLAALAHEKKILRFKIGWSYFRNRPIFAYCEEGHELEAIARFRKMLSVRRLQQRKNKLVDDYLSEFRAACVEMKANEGLADLAGTYFDRTLKSRLARGRDTRLLAWSAYFLASKILKQGITPGEIQSFAKVKRRKLLAVSKDLNDILQLSVTDLYPQPRDYLRKIVMNMELPKKLYCSGGSIETAGLLQETERFFSSLPKKVLFGKRAESLAAAVLYLTAKRLGILECTQKYISEAADITEVTLRNTVKSVKALCDSWNVAGQKISHSQFSPTRLKATIMVDNKLWTSFLSFIVTKHGTTRKVSDEIEKVLEEYLKNHTMEV